MIYMSPRNGRSPSNDPKEYRKSYRLSEGDVRKLNACIEKTGMSATDIIRKGIDMVYREVTQK